MFYVFDYCMQGVVLDILKLPVFWLFEAIVVHRVAGTWQITSGALFCVRAEAKHPLANVGGKYDAQRICDLVGKSSGGDSTLRGREKR